MTAGPSPPHSYAEQQIGQPVSMLCSQISTQLPHQRLCLAAGGHGGPCRTSGKPRHVCSRFGHRRDAAICSSAAGRPALRVGDFEWPMVEKIYDDGRSGDRSSVPYVLCSHCLPWPGGGLWRPQRARQHVHVWFSTFTTQVLTKRAYIIITYLVYLFNSCRLHVN